MGEARIDRKARIAVALIAIRGFLPIRGYAGEVLKGVQFYDVPVVSVSVHLT